MRRMLTQAFIFSLLCLAASKVAEAGPMALADVQNGAWSDRTLREDVVAFSDLSTAQPAVYEHVGYNYFENFGSHTAEHLDSVFFVSVSKVPQGHAVELLRSEGAAAISLFGPGAWLEVESFRGRGHAWGHWKHANGNSQAPQAPVAVVPVPEPATITLLGIGFLFAAFLYRRTSTHG